MRFDHPIKSLKQSAMAAVENKIMEWGRKKSCQNLKLRKIESSDIIDETIERSKGGGGEVNDETSTLSFTSAV